MENLEQEVEEIERQRLVLEKKLQEMLRYETEYRLRKLLNYKLAQQTKRQEVIIANPFELLEWAVGSMLAMLERWIGSLIASALKRER